MAGGRAKGLKVEEVQTHLCPEHPADAGRGQ